MSDDTFPFAESSWHQNESLSKGWLRALEKTGAENVRARLAQVTTGSRGSITIGTAATITIGFAEEWLAWKDNQKSAKEASRHERQIFWTRTAAIAACIAGSSAAIGWAWTIFHK